MTGKDEELDVTSKSMPVLEDSQEDQGEGGGGDKALTRRKTAESPAEKNPKKDDKPVRPKNFKPLTADEEKLIHFSETGKIEEIRALLRNKKMKVDCLDDVSLRLE